MLGRELQRSLQSEGTVEKDENGFEKPASGKQTVATMLGLMGSIAVETIMTDISGMIDKNMFKELDGYIFALSRIMRHDMAWQCIVHSFAEKNEPIPAKYYSHFKQSMVQQKQRMTAQSITPPTRDGVS